MNDQAHELMVSALSVSHNQLSEVPPPSSLVTIRSGYTLTLWWKAILQEQLHAEPLHNTICSNNCWTDDQFDMVDWAALQTCLKSYSHGCLLSQCKLLHGIRNTNEQNNKFYKLPAQCPHCHDKLESFWHMFSCANPEAAKYRNEQQDILWKTLEHLHTPARIVDHLKMGITATVPHTAASSASQSSTTGADQSSIPSSLAVEIPVSLPFINNHRV